MSLDLVPATEVRGGQQSCVYDVHWSSAGLSVFVETYPPDSRDCVNYEVRFEGDRGFVLLDEADLPTWTNYPALASGYVLYEVAGGGWLQAQPGDSLAVASSMCKEWLVATSNECVSVFSQQAPTIQRLKHDAT